MRNYLSKSLFWCHTSSPSFTHLWCKLGDNRKYLVMGLKYKSLRTSLNKHVLSYLWTVQIGAVENLRSFYPLQFVVLEELLVSFLLFRLKSSINKKTLQKSLYIVQSINLYTPSDITLTYLIRGKTAKLRFLVVDLCCTTVFVKMNIPNYIMLLQIVVG